MGTPLCASACRDWACVQVVPPSAETAAPTVLPFRPGLSLKEIEMAWAVAPFAGLAAVRGPNETRGSDAASYGRSAGALAAQELNGSGTTLHEAPPSPLTPAARPCAPPLLQRSCW